MTIDDRWIMAAGEMLISPFNPEAVTPIGYDLSIKTIAGCKSFRRLERYSIDPGESVLAQSVEMIHLPNNVLATIHARNTYIRLGIVVDAPVYQPGHSTYVYFRATNTSNEPIELSAESGVAMIMFERLARPVRHAYNGKYQGEAIR